MKTKKKYSLFKVLLIVLLLIVIATYFLGDRDGSISHLALGDVFVNYVQSLYYFFDTAIFILVVGGLYGALNKVPAYKKLVRELASKVDDNKRTFVIAVTIIFALVSSLTGLNLLLFIFIPFFVSVILILGYDKLTALSATILATMVGFIGGIFVTLNDVNTSSYVTFDTLVGLDGNFSNVLARILLLVFGVGILVFFIVKHIESIENGEEVSELDSNDVFMVEAKDKKGNVIIKDTDKKIWPIATLGIIVLVLLILGYVPWNSLFGIEVFDNLHTWVTGISIGDYYIYTAFFSASNFVAFGEWTSLGSFMIAIILMALFILIIKYVSKVKYKDLMDGFLYGMKKMLPAVMLVLLAYTVLICAYNNGFVEALIENAADAFGDNVFVNSLLTALGSVLNVDTYYTSAGIFSNILSGLSDSANLNLYSIMFQSVFGLMQIIGPTSLMLIIGLSYLDIPYKKWLQYIWRFVLYLIILILVIMIVVSLI